MTSLSWLGVIFDLGLGSALITLIEYIAAARNAGRMRDALAATLLGGTGVMAAILVGSGAIVQRATAGEERVVF